MQAFCVLWGGTQGQTSSEGSRAPEGCLGMPARVGSPKSWWGSERLAGLRKHGSWGKLRGAGPGYQTHRKLEGDRPGPALKDQVEVEAWLALLGVAQA